ncbi:MAG: hypothetical protein ACFHX7_23450 [Pseudomonadota bacterium]
MKPRIPDQDESRRQFLLYLLGAGAIASLPGCASTPAPVQQLMPVPEKMPANRSIFQIMGDLKVNGSVATLDTPIRPGDLVETGAASEAIFVVQEDAFLLRADTRMLIPRQMVGDRYDLQQGKALSVFASRQMGISTPSAVISIRGTGVYIEAEPVLSYVCLCYGAANLATASDPNINEDLVTEHHDAPKYILSDRNAANRIQPAPFKNHSDQELLLIETLVGRSTPYVVPRGVRRSRSRYI